MHHFFFCLYAIQLKKKKKTIQYHMGIKEIKTVANQSFNHQMNENK